VEASLSATCPVFRVRRSLSLALVLVAGSVPGRVAAQDVSRCQTAVVEIRAYDASGADSMSALGFFVEMGHLVTDARLLRSSHRARVVIGDQEYAVTAVLAEDRGAQLVMVAVDLPDGAPPPLVLAPAIAAQGDHVVLLSPAAPANAEGTISAVQEIPGFGTVFTTTIHPAADVGAPVIDRAGRVVGIASTLVAGSRRSDFYVAAPHLRAMTRLRPVTLDEWSAGAPGLPARDDAAYREAVRLSLERKYEAALPRFRKLMEQNPRDSEVHVAAGICLEELGRTDEAVSAYKQALTTDPEDPRTWYRLGVTLIDLARWEDAINAFSRAVLLRPNDPHSHYNLGLAYGGLGRLAQEVEAYSRSIRLDPEHAPAYNNLGVAYISLKRYKDAVVALSRAVRLSPRNADAHANLGVAYADLGQLNDGATALREAIRLSPSSPKAHYALGVVLAALGDERAAASEQHLLERLDPERARQLAVELARRKTASGKEPG
jgi:Flp pilus assembly protein TadD